MDRRKFFHYAGTLGLGAVFLPKIEAKEPVTRQGRGARLAERANAHLRSVLDSLEQINHATNGDRESVEGFLANYSKGLPHDEYGQVSPVAFEWLETAARQGDFEKMEGLPRGGHRKQANPLGGHALSLEAGCDPHALPCTPPPALGSRRLAAELCELYWMERCRDVPFEEYADSEEVRQAWGELKALLPEYAESEPEEAFRGLAEGDSVGPYVSQFLLLDFISGALEVPQRYRVAVPGVDFLGDYEDWLRNVRGFGAREAMRFLPEARHIQTGRDLAECVHRDFSSQLLLQAALILLGGNYSQKARRFSFSRSNPYLSSWTQDGFSTFGEPEIMDLIARASTLALRACWHQKWCVHLMLRPEEAAGRLEAWRLKNGGAFLFNEDLQQFQVVKQKLERSESFLLSQAYPEGCPMHPAYPSGHAVLAGAGATILKACFEENAVFPRPVKVGKNGLEPLDADLKVGAEINKLAANVAMGRNFAGIHWRCDASEGLRLGEAAAIMVLRCLKDSRKEPMSEAMQITSFDGKTLLL